MATDISKEINQLKNAVYGEEVRGAFISCMEKIHEENESYDNIKAQVAQSAENVEKQVGTINTKAEEVQTSLDNLADAISNGKKQQTAIEQSVEKGKTQQTNLEETIKNAKTQQSTMIEELEENSNTQVNNFNTYVAEKTQESEQAIADARQQAVQTVKKQEELSEQAVKDRTAEYIEEQKNTAKEEIDSRAEEIVSELKEDISSIYAWKEITSIEVVDGKLLQLESKEEFIATDARYSKTEIPDNVKKIKVSGRSASAQYGYGLGAFYDANWGYIESIDSEDLTEYDNKEVNVPRLAKYIIINFNNVKAKNVSAFMVIPVANELRKIDDLCNDNTIQIQKNISNILDIQKKFEFDIEMNIAGILDADPTQPTKITYSDDENARCSDYIDCQNFKYISAKCNGSEWSWVIAFFDADKLFLPDISIIGEAGKLTYEVKIPESAKYVRISHYNIEISYKAKIFFSEENIDANIFDLQKRVAAIEAPDDVYNGCEFSLFRKWGLIGDSLSVGHTVSKDGKTTLGRNIYYSWGQYLARRIGNTCLNFGRSGVTSKLWMDTSETYCYPRLINPDNLCQAYIIALGANDSEMTLGSIADVNFTDMSQNADTEYGCYAKVINAVRNVSANVPIFLFTLPYPRNSDVKIKAINEMIRTFASDKEHFEKIFLVDLDADYNKYFETGKLEAQIGNTGWHLTSLGYLYASKVNEIALSKVISDNYSDFQDVFLLPCGNNDVLD